MILNIDFPSYFFSPEYYSMVIVPAGARSIRVQEMEVSTSYLAVRSLKRKYYLTGDWTVDWPGKFHFGGTIFDYQRSFNKPESLYAAGPTNETLVFEVSRRCRLMSICGNWQWQGPWQSCCACFSYVWIWIGLDGKKKKVCVIGRTGVVVAVYRTSVRD